MVSGLDLTNCIDEQDFAGIDPIAGHQLPDEDLVRACHPVKDLKS